MTQQLHGQTIVVTGATSGIGRATALMLAQHGAGRLILTGRRMERLEEVKQQIEALGAEVLTLQLDVRDRNAVERAFASLPGGEWRKIDILINNAGLASGLDPFNTGNVDDWEKMIDTNVKGLLYVSRAVAPLMVEQKHGHIINLASIAGKEVYACGNVYCASKHAVDALTRAMRIDLLPYGIKVGQVAPGAVNTEFSTVRFHGDSERAGHVYDGYEPLTADDIAACILFMVTAPDHVNVADMLVFPKAQADGRTFHREQ